jgi:hypothetical protein
MAKKSEGLKDLATFQGIPVDSYSLAKTLEQQRPKGKYFESYPTEAITTSMDGNEANYNLLGYVTPKDPNYLHLRESIAPQVANRLPQHSSLYGVFEHERQHAIDRARKDENIYPINSYLWNVPANETSYRPYIEHHMRLNQDPKYTWDNPNAVTSSQKMTDIKNPEHPVNTQMHLNNIFKKYEDRLSVDFPREGFFAEMKAYERTLPPGINMLDTAFGKEVFGGRPELLQTYFSATRPQNVPSMTEDIGSKRYKYEEPKIDKTKSKSTIDKVRDYMRKTTTYKEGGKIKLPDGYKTGGSSGLI